MMREKLLFKLESLARANSFSSNNAHEAIADVETTMKLLEVLFTKNSDLFRTFIHNSFPAKLEERILENDIFTLHNYFLTIIEYI